MPSDSLESRTGTASRPCETSYASSGFLASSMPCCSRGIPIESCHMIHLMCVHDSSKKQINSCCIKGGQIMQITHHNMAIL